MRNPAAWAWLALLFVAQPVAAFRGSAGLDRRRRPRLRLYRGSAAGIGAIGLVSVAVDAAARGEAMTATLLPLPLRSLVYWSSAGVAGMAGFWLLVQVARRHTGSAPRQALLHLLPRTGAERVAFTGLSRLAGACEDPGSRHGLPRSMAGHASLNLAQGFRTLPLLRRWGVVGAEIDAPPSS